MPSDSAIHSKTRAVWEVSSQARRTTEAVTAGFFPRQPSYIWKSRKEYLNSNLYVNIHSSVICNSPKVKSTQISKVDEWINRTWYVHAMRYYLTVKKRRKFSYILQHETLCSEKKVRQKWTDIVCSCLYEVSRIGKFTEIERLETVRGWEKGKMATYVLTVQSFHFDKWESFKPR